MKSKSKAAICALMATGIVIASAGIDVANPGTGWAALVDQEASKQTKEGLSIFESATKTNTNLTG